MLGRIREVVFPDSRAARSMTFFTLGTALSSGAYYSISAIYFTQVLHIAVIQVGLGLTIAGGAGVASAFVSGRIIDRVRSPVVMMVGAIGQAAATFCLLAAGSFLPFVVIASVIAVFRMAQSTARAAVIAQAFDDDDRVLVRSRLRVILNLAFGLGALGGGLVLAIRAPAAYLVALSAIGVVLLLSALPLIRLGRELRPDATPRASRAPAGGPGSTPTWSWRYLWLTAANAVIDIHLSILVVGIPLWISASTSVPTWVVSILLVENTVLGALIQIRLSRGTETVIGARRKAILGSVVLAVSCGVYAATGAELVVWATLALIGAMALHTFGEISSDAGTAGLSYLLAPEGMAGRYQGVFVGGSALSAMIAPAIVTASISLGPIGWVLMGGIFLLAGVAVRLVVPDRYRTVVE